MNKVRFGLFFPCFILGIFFLSSWGSLAHHTITQLAVYQLPKKMQGFFYQNRELLVTTSTRPDDRRRSDKTEASKHFVDIEAYGSNAVNDMPLEWEDAVKKYTKDSLLKYGYVPYHVVAMKNELTKAFESRDKEKILFFAADIAHYIEDANVPLHTTNNYDGQLSNQKGIHALWESLVPEAELEQYNLYTYHKATYLKQPSLAIWNAVRDANGLLKDVLAKEKEVSTHFSDSTKYISTGKNGKKHYSPEFIKAYGEALKPTVNKQLLASASLLSDFWFTAWSDAGKPDIDSLMLPLEKDDLGWKKEYRSYKHNNLIKDSLLISKKTGKELY